jgi:hypothetical protein
MLVSEVDAETGETTLIGCYIESRHPETRTCSIIDTPSGKPTVDPRDPAQELGEHEVLLTPPTSGGSTPGSITDHLPRVQEVLPTPQESTTQEDTRATDGPTEEE